MSYTCPVCAFDELDEPPVDWNICPCCGTEFGYDDHAKSHADLYDAWVANGAKWFSKRRNPPIGWSFEDQLRRAGRAPVVPSAR